jgi:hypothetical protein
MHLAVVRVRVREVLLHVLGQQVAPVAGRVDQHVGRGRRDRSVEDGLQGLVAGLALLEAQVVAEHHELLGPPETTSTMSGRSTRSALSTSISRSPRVRVFVQAGLDERRLARAAGAGQQHVVGRLAGDELLGVALDAFPSAARFPSGHPADAGHVPHRLERAVATGPLAVAPGDGVVPLGAPSGCGSTASMRSSSAWRAR